MTAPMRLSLPLSSNLGCLLAVVGCAKSGKTKELVSVASVCNALGVGFQLFEHSGSATPSGNGAFELTDEAGPWTSKAQLVRSPSEIYSAVKPHTRVIMVDNLHLFDNEILPVFQDLIENRTVLDRFNPRIERRTIIVAAGRDMTYEGEPFSCVASVLALADQVLKLHAVCDLCGSDAAFTAMGHGDRERPLCRRCLIGSRNTPDRTGIHA